MEQPKKPGFLEDFPAVTTAEWEARIMEDLKGADYRKRLVWKTHHGVEVMPYYRAEHLEALPFMGSLPGEAPFVRGNKTGNNGWEVRQDFDDEDLAKANALARKAIANGVQAVGLNVGQVHDGKELARLLQGIDLARTAVHLLHSKNYLPLFRNLLSLAPDTGFRGSLNFDPLGYMLLHGAPYGSLDNNMADAAELLRLAAGRSPGFRVITVNGQHVHNAGAGIVQELAFLLSQGNEYLASLTDQGFTADEVAPAMQFRLAIGSDYFPEIAKVRAAKMLWSAVVAQYHPTKEESRMMNIQAESSMWNKAVYDPYTNLLRTSTEAMSAAIGGVDALVLHPFDATFRPPGDFSLRLARNQQNVLKHEAYFDKVVDPAAGSYYIENLTHSVAEAAWQLFVQTEEQGGFTACAGKGFLKEEIEKTCRQRDMDIAMRKTVFIGVNQYPGSSERLPENDLSESIPPESGGLRTYRGPQAFEALRLAVERHGKNGFDTPKVFLLTFGNLAMRKARAAFSANFFEIAGYQVTEGAGHAAAAEGMNEAADSGAHVVVLCSSDDEYATATETIAAIKKRSPKTLVVVAGNPAEHIEQLTQAGVDKFIHLRNNALEALTWFVGRLRD